MSTRPLAAAWSPTRAFAALFVSGFVLGGGALAAAFALLAVTLVFNAGGLLFQLLIVGIKVLVPLFLAVFILSTGLIGFFRFART